MILLWHFYDTSMTLLWYFFAIFSKSIIAYNNLYIISIMSSFLPIMILWHFFDKKKHLYVCAREDGHTRALHVANPKNTYTCAREKTEHRAQEGDMPDDITAFFGGSGCSRLVLPNGGQRIFSVVAPSDCQRIFSWDAGIATAFHNGRKPKERAANMRVAYFDHYKQSGISTKKT